MIRAVEHATPQNPRLHFQIDAAAVAPLQHPPIVEPCEVGDVRGQPYSSLEFCGGGGTLTERPEKKCPSRREAAEPIS